MAKLLPLFKAQKKVMRVIFWDRAKYLDKFKTCARVRPFNEQRLLTEFFIKEHSKPLFNSRGFLNLKTFTFITVAVKFSKFSSTKVLLQSMTYLNFQVVVKEACL